MTTKNKTPEEAWADLKKEMREAFEPILLPIIELLNKILK
jgi:hypothetical protein